MPNAITFRIEWPIFWPDASNEATYAFSVANQTNKSPRGHAWRRTPRFKVANGKRYQLHATRGWKCVGRASRC